MFFFSPNKFLVIIRQNFFFKSRVFLRTNLKILYSDRNRIPTRCIIKCSNFTGFFRSFIRPATVFLMHYVVCYSPILFHSFSAIVCCYCWFHGFVYSHWPQVNVKYSFCWLLPVFLLKNKNSICNNLITSFFSTSLISLIGL